ncbi:FtsX-like permease family protein [Sinosporangium siamense]
MAVTVIDLRHPLAAGMVTLVKGRLPVAAGEAVVAETARIPVGRPLGLQEPATSVRVVGVVRTVVGYGNYLGVFPGSLPQSKPSRAMWLADLPGTASVPADVRGYIVQARTDDENRRDVWNLTSLDDDWDALPTLAVLSALAVVEVALLAGPAFLIGWRRRARELALIAAQGGSARQVRLVVLVDGFVLGAVSAVTGAGLGVAAVWAAARLLPPIPAMGPFDVPWIDVGLLAGLGALSASVAALLPALQAARTDTAAVLAGRRSAPRGGRGRPVAGGVLLVAGGALILASAQSFSAPVFLLGGLLGQLGVAAVAPGVLGLVAKCAPWAPLPLRLAVRDAVRNRGRTAPAVAAVIAAVAASTGIMVAATSEHSSRSSQYLQLHPVGAAVVRWSGQTPAEWRAVAATLRRELPGVPLAETSLLGDRTRYAMFDAAAEGAGCVWPCDHLVAAGLPVGDGNLLRYLLGKDDPVSQASLAAGKAVVFDARLVERGQIRITVRAVEADDGDDVESVRTVTLPAVTATPESGTKVQMVLPLSAAERLGTGVRASAYLVDRRLDADELERVEKALLQHSPHLDVYIESGPQSNVDLYLRAGAVVASLVALATALIIGGLAGADARPDIASLTAIGASRRVRRWFTVGQAGLIVALGAVLGVIAGVMVGCVVAAAELGLLSGFVWETTFTGDSTAYWRDRPDLVLDVPWTLLAGTVLVLPPAAAAVSALFTRTDEPLTRRQT